MRLRRSANTRTGVVATVSAGILIALSACSSASTDDNEAAPSPPPAAEERAPSTSAAPAEPAPDEAPETTQAPAESLTTLPAPAPLPTLADLDGSIMIRDGDGGLRLLGPNGTVIATLADADQRLLSQPTWSRDATAVAWSTIDADGAAMEIASTDGTSSARVPLPSPPFYLSWSTEDSSIGALRPTEGGIEFLIVDATAGSARPIGTGQPFYFDWRNDESLVAAVNGTTLAEISTSTEVAPTQLSIGSPLGVFQAPAVIDDDPRQIIVALVDDGDNSLTILGDGQQVETLGRARDPLSIAVTPDGRTVAALVVDSAPQSQVISFQTDLAPELPSGRVSLIDIDTGDVDQRPETGVIAMQWSPDGATLALLQRQQDALQWLVVEGETTTALTPFVPSRELATSYLPFADQYNHSSTWWSPDSRAMVMAGSIGDEAGIWVDRVDDDAGAARVSDGDIAVWSPR